MKQLLCRLFAACLLLTSGCQPVAIVDVKLGAIYRVERAQIHVFSENVERGLLDPVAIGVEIYSSDALSSDWTVSAKFCGDKRYIPGLVFPDLFWTPVNEPRAVRLGGAGRFVEQSSGPSRYLAVLAIRQRTPRSGPDWPEFDMSVTPRDVCLSLASATSDGFYNFASSGTLRVTREQISAALHNPVANAPRIVNGIRLYCPSRESYGDYGRQWYLEREAEVAGYERCGPRQK